MKLYKEVFRVIVQKPFWVDSLRKPHLNQQRMDVATKIGNLISSALFSWIDFDRLKVSYFLFMRRLNSGIQNRHYFFEWAFFLFQKLRTDSVIYADSGDINIFVQFPGNSIFNFPQNFEIAWAPDLCVGVSPQKSPIWFRFNSRNFNPP